MSGSYPTQQQHHEHHHYQHHPPSCDPSSSYPLPAFVHRDSGYSGAPSDLNAMRQPPYDLPTAYTTASYRLPGSGPSAMAPPPPPQQGGPSLYSAAALLQQHQANQHAFLSGQTGGNAIFSNLAVRGSESPVTSTSGSSATPSSHGRSSATPASSAHEPSTSAPLPTQPPPSSSSNAPVSPQDADFSQTFYDPFRIKHRRRTSPPQLRVLEYHFDRNPKPDVSLRRALSEQLDMTPREVQVWFQNRRAKVKKLREKAEREAATAGEADTPRLPTPPPALAALNGSVSQLSMPPAPLGRAEYGADDVSARAPSMFSAPPTPHDQSFRPMPTAPSYLSMPPGPPPSVLAAYPPPPPTYSSYPSPLPSSGQSATPSPPIDYQYGHPHATQAVASLPHPPPLPLPTYLEAGYPAPPGRRMSLPAHALYDVAMGPPLGSPSSTTTTTFEQAVSSLPPPPLHAPMQHVPPTSLPSTCGGPPCYDQLAPAPIHAHAGAAYDGVLGGGSGGGGGNSPRSSYGDGSGSVPLGGGAEWDGSAQQQPQQAMWGERAPYAPQLARRRSSAPGEMLLQPLDHASQPYGRASLAYATAPQQQWGAEYSTVPLSQQQQQQPSSSSFGYSAPPPPNGALSAPLSAHSARRASVVSLAPISEQPHGQEQAHDGGPVRRPRSGNGHAAAHPYARSSRSGSGSRSGSDE
ncbi:uncharacterized protein RHOBADRAFT_51574 [Rhodotorula graminis WP1]|uniref:Homeobox domain-containing protein n=2 Tax=Rhodotorula TaxID=5533 RepID=A0A194SAY9_RHOGW|nr:uncharacterized protein RHOBADRAFT_51574 [Rhodotorula graminis WP1]KPV77759.1 hypothetical protein RHOBADRAFT_51574 [Rhodotorula graminis WP1]